MQTIGIIRNIDDLGRIAIPKEIRRSMRINVGDPMEIRTCEEGLVLKKYATEKNMEKEAQEWLQTHKQAMRYLLARFTIDGDITTCECVHKGVRMVGTAKRNPTDTYSPAIGMVYAMCRACGGNLPDGW